MKTTERTLISSVECKEVEESLMARLGKDSPDVKYKALVCIKHVAINGREDFRLSLQRKSDPIRACARELCVFVCVTVCVEGQLWC